MAPLKFEKLLCGPSVDLLTKDFAHENIWEVEQTDAQKRGNFVNNLKLDRNGALLGSTHLKCNVGPVHAELKMQNSAAHHIEMSAVNPKYTPMSVHGKYAFDISKGSKTCELVAEHVHPMNTSQLKVLPLVKSFSAFSLFNYRMNCRQLSCGTEVTGNDCNAFSNYSFGLGYKNTHKEKTYVVSARLFGEKDNLVKSLVGNIYAGTSHGSAQNALSVALEHNFSDAATKLKFAGLWHLTEPDHPTPAYVKGKCDTEGKIALTLFQRFNKNFAAAVGVDFNGKQPINPSNANYGFKVLLS
ncbi:eukaryotic porin protein [Babesia caballi]|uniref:Eukaryotic porin protein n=1 Tax=Babesia caballi TaxID=5871 RepID=A0AAV4LPK1_BABCB|nr:eukaryotic porin protein [Babesia caballi]